MVSRDGVAAGAFVAFLVALFTFYGLTGDWMDIDLMSHEAAFWLAVASWVALYVYSGGMTLDDKGSIELGLFAGSWAILLLAALETGVLAIGIETDILMGFVEDTEYIEVGFVGIHAASAYAVWRADP